MNVLCRLLRCASYLLLHTYNIQQLNQCFCFVLFLLGFVVFLLFVFVFGVCILFVSFILVCLCFVCLFLVYFLFVCFCLIFVFCFVFVFCFCFVFVLFCLFVFLTGSIFSRNLVDTNRLWYLCLYIECKSKGCDLLWGLELNEHCLMFYIRTIRANYHAWIWLFPKKCCWHVYFSDLLQFVLFHVQYEANVLVICKIKPFVITMSSFVDFGNFSEK